MTASKQGLYSRLGKLLRKGAQKSAALTLQSLFRVRSYSLFGIPRGVTYSSVGKVVIYPAERVEFKPAKTVGAPSSYYPGHLSLTGKEGGILKIPGGTATRWGGALDSKGRLVAEYLYVEDDKPPEQHDLFKVRPRNFFPPVYHASEPVIAVATGKQDAFYHWMYEVCPKLGLVEKAQLHKMPLFIGAQLSYQKETLALLNVENPIIDAGLYQAVTAPEIFAPAIPASGTPWATNFLREKFLPKIPVTAHKRRLYISRQDAEKRRIVNEDAVMGLLSTYGFERVELARIPLLDQMSLFRNAEAIVAPHGAGLSHSVFCDPNTPLLECFAPSFVNPCYFHVASQIGLNYAYLFGEQEQNDAIDPDFVVDLAKIQASLDLLGIDK